VFDGLTFIGAADDDSTTQFGISQNGTTASPSGVICRDLRFIPSGTDTAVNDGIKIYNAEDWQIEGIYVKNLHGTDNTNTGYGILTGFASRIHVKGGIFVGGTDRGRHAVYLTVGTSDCTVEGVTVAGFKRSGIVIKAGPTGDSCDRNLISNCKVLDYGSAVADQAAIVIGGAGAGNRIVGCVVDGSADEGIAILPGDYEVADGFTAGDLADNSIEGCTIRNCVGLGIELQSTTRTLISGCRIHNVGTGGAQAAIGVRGNGNFGQGDDTGLHVQGCYISSPGRASVEISTLGTTPPSGVVITGNDLAVGSTGDAIRDITRPGIWELHNIIDGDADKVATATVNDTTPSVRNTRVLLMPQPSPAVVTTLTALDDGVEGQVVDVHFRTAFFVVDFTGTTLKGNGGADWTPANGDMMRCVKQSTNWYCSVHDCS
jgi:parallel beta-helix repeat protein